MNKINDYFHLYKEAKLNSTKPFKARGSKITRCHRCFLKNSLCICEYRKTLETNVNFLILMHSNEILKPSNTGKLIVDLFPKTKCFKWDRKNPGTELLNELNNDKIRPVIIFPNQYLSEPNREIDSAEIQSLNYEKFLFIILDGSWYEARKMFRSSEYLKKFPVLSLNSIHISEYRLRSSDNKTHLSTAEVAANILKEIGEGSNAKKLFQWFELFNSHYMNGKKNIDTKNDHLISKILTN